MLKSCNGSFETKRKGKVDREDKEKPIEGTSEAHKILLVGYPNVGKSVVFNALTGAYVVVSNYPGTTVAIDRGKAEVSGHTFEVIDTPGAYSLVPITEEERVARTILFTENPRLVVNVMDAKNIDRMLHLTLQLIETGLPVIVMLNIMDEAKAEGMEFDIHALEAALGVPIIPATAVKGEGMEALKKYIASALDRGLAQGRRVKYGTLIEKAVAKIEDLLKGDYPVSKRSVALLLLQGDENIEKTVKKKEEENFDSIVEEVAKIKDIYARPLDYVITTSRQEQIDKLFSRTVRSKEDVPLNIQEKISRAMIRPLTGVPFLILVLIGLYLLVGVLGASILVDFIEGTIFEGQINPAVDSFLEENVPWEQLRDLIGGEFGVITLGLRYALAIILPIVCIFFLVFSILEDSGYLPRLSLLIDRVFKLIGLSGRAVIPMTLGLGCDTMGTLVTRTLETKKERVMATLLLALAVPCSAQLGVIFAVLSVSIFALFIWALVIFLVMLFIGFLGSRLIPGGKPQFFMELPPLRLPKISNVLIKTYTRMVWYLKEVLPIFLIVSVFLWAGDLLGVFEILIEALDPVMVLLGLPTAAAPIFIYGLFRRDYGAAGLYDMSANLSIAQLTVAAVTLTLFIPCIAQVMMMYKERGKKVTLGIVAFIFPFAFFIGYLLNLVLTSLGVFV